MKFVIVTLVLFVSTIVLPDYCDGYRILGIFPLHMRSHFMMNEALMKGLADKGHQVDVISPYPQKKPYPNYTDIMVFPGSLTLYVNNITYDVITSRTGDIVAIMGEVFGNNLCKGLDLPEMRNLINNPPKNPPYDLVVLEAFAAHCFLALSHHLKVPSIGTSTAALYPWLNGIVANPANLAFVPNNLMAYVPPMTFRQRLWNTITAVYCDLYFQYITSVQDDIIKRNFPAGTPSLRELERKLDLILTNSHISLNGPKPFTPAVVEVGGIHIRDDGSELSPDLIKWMDESTEGFVYFTFGSMVRIETFPKNIVKIFYKSLEKIKPVRVLMRIAEPNDLLSGMPKNFRTFTWTNQRRVLKHKNIKAFITHGGLMGTLEGISSAVPLIGIPLFADQFTNMDLYEAKKVAVKLNIKELTEEKMDAALNAVLYNPIYKKTVVELSNKFHDRPMTPIDTATWWVEYIIRHGGGSTLRSPAMDLAWWQNNLLDVYAVILLGVGFAIFIILTAIKWIIRKNMRSPKVTHSKKVK